MNTNFLNKALLFCFMIVVFASCDKDFNEIGSGIVGDDHFGFEKSTDVTVLAYNQSLGPVQSNNLPINALGYYNHPVFGKTKSSFLTQVSLIAADPTFQPNPVVTKVQLSIPYFSTKLETLDSGASTYRLDSIYGNAKFKLGIYESQYYLRDFDPSPGSGLQNDQKYYSDFNIGANYNTVRLNDDVSAGQNDEFFFSNGETVESHQENGEVVIDSRKAPAMNINLNKAFFQQKIFSAMANGNLTNNNVFKNYFRGLYFKVDEAASSPEQGSLNQMDFKQGKILITYMVDDVDANGLPILADGAVVREEKSLTISLTGNSVSIIENENAQPYLTNITTNVNTTSGDDRLYVRGQQGSMAVLDLFGKTDAYHYEPNPTDDNLPWTLVNTPNGVPDELDEIRNNGWLINEANLTFYVDRTTFTSGYEPNRIYLYDLNNKRPLLDYYSDGSAGSKPKYNKIVHSGIIVKEAVDNGRGIKYKVRITNHIKNLLTRNKNAVNDSINVRLGLVVTESIGTITSARLKTNLNVNYSGVPATLPQGFVIDRTPTANVINPLGTVLFGSTVNVPEDKRLKLEIYYTKPD